MNTMRELTKAEEQIMQVLWKLEKGFRELIWGISDHCSLDQFGREYV